MKTEFGILVACTIIVVGVLTLIANDPNETVSFSGLEKINQKAKEAKESENQKDLDAYRSKMKNQLQSVTSSALGVKIDSIYLKDDWNFPFRDSSQVKHTMEEYKKTPICNILPNLSLHLQNIRETELFSMYGEKYQDYFIELDIADERYHNSTVHYGFSAKSGNKHASTFFHVDSCTGKTSNYLFLRCHDSVIGNDAGSNYPSEVITSLQNDEFCEIDLEPWRQELADYNKRILGDAKKYLDQLSMKNKSTEEMIKINHELQRLDSLDDMSRHAMMGNYENEQLHDKMEKYKKMFGDVPDEFLELIKENEN